MRYLATVAAVASAVLIIAAPGHATARQNLQEPSLGHEVVCIQHTFPNGTQTPKVCAPWPHPW